MRMIQSPCKICGRPAVAKFEDNAIQESVDKWLPMLTHDTCFDRHVKLRDAEEMITKTCFVFGRMTASDQGKMIAKSRLVLLAATRSYAEAYADAVGSRTVLYNEQFTDMLLREPDRAYEMLSRYRDEVRRLAKT